MRYLLILFLFALGCTDHKNGDIDYKTIYESCVEESTSIGITTNGNAAISSVCVKKEKVIVVREYRNSEWRILSVEVVK